MISRVVFWQLAHSPHQFALLDAVSKHPKLPSVELVISRGVDVVRQDMNWSVSTYAHIKVHEAPSAADIDLLAGRQVDDSLHIFSGLEADMIGKEGLKACIRHGTRIAVMAEAADWNGHGPKRYLRLAKHKRLRQQYGRHVQAIFPMGQLGVEWYRRVGYARRIMTPFAYFVEPERVAPAPVDTFGILFVGRAVDYKGGDLLLRSLAALPPLDWQATFITQGPERANWEALSRTLGLDDQVSFENFKPALEVAQAMASASVLVLPNKADEGWGAVVNEALMQGTPVICTTVTGAKDMVGEDRGQVVEPSVSALAAALERQISAGIPMAAQRERIAAHTRLHWSGQAGAERLVSALERLE